MEPVQEAYFGKTKNLIQAERVIAKIMNKLKLKKLEDYPKRVVETAVEINKSKENKELCRLLKEQFGFKEMIIHWDGQWEVNAYSMARGIIKMVSEDMPRLPVKQKDGGYYDAGHNYLCCVNVYAGLIDEKLTPAEIMAVILHEIGHNFQCTPLHSLFCVTDYLWIPVYFNQGWEGIKSIAYHGYDILTAWSVYLWFTRATNTLVAKLIGEKGSEYLKQAFQDFDNWLTKNKAELKRQLAEMVRDYKKQQEEIKKDKDQFASGVLFNLAMAWITSIANGIMAPTWLAGNIYDAQSGYTGEVFADSFATAYGYGAETVSVQSKFENMNFKTPYFSKQNKYHTYNQYLLVMMELTITLLDPHPLAQTRIKNQINKLRRELNSKDVPPELKVSIEKDLAKAEKLYDEYLKMTPAQRHLAVIINFRNINETYFGGKLELRDLINRMLNFGKAEA